jgi:hypothetical protein
MVIVEMIHKSLMITAFVAVMMLVLESLSVQTHSVLLRALHGSSWRQYMLLRQLWVRSPAVSVLTQSSPCTPTARFRWVR